MLPGCASLLPGQAEPAENDPLPPPPDTPPLTSHAETAPPNRVRSASEVVEALLSDLVMPEVATETVKDDLADKSHQHQDAGDVENEQAAAGARKRKCSGLGDRIAHMERYAHRVSAWACASCIMALAIRQYRIGANITWEQWSCAITAQRSLLCSKDGEAHVQLANQEE